MWSALVLTVLVPQAPSTIGAAIAEIQAEQEVSEVVAAAVAEQVDRAKGSLRGIDSPVFGGRLRRQGIGALDMVEQRVAFGEGELTVSNVTDLAAALWMPRVRAANSKRLDLRAFEKLCERVHRDLLKAVGSGRDIQTSAARLQAVIDRVRIGGVVAGGGGDGWDDASKQLISERFLRVARSNRNDMVDLSRRLLAGAVQLMDPKLIKRMSRKKAGAPRSIEGVRGDVLHDCDASFGRFVVGGFGKNEYDCTQVDVIIDFGGDDVYRGPAGGAGTHRRLALVIDLGGNDRYQTLNDGLGAATFGIGICLDAAGDDVYRGGERCLGFGAAGVGIWADLAGVDDIEVGALSAGVGLAGVGVAVDLAGDDKQVAGSESFGCGLPGGLGLFVDAAGNDKREAGSVGVELRAKSEPVSAAFGVGIGALPILAGGVGVCLDLDGADRYVASGVALGAGWSGGCGVFRDSAGQDTYMAGFAALGAAVRNGVGVAIDGGGDDSYTAAELCFGGAIDRAAGWFSDVAGDDSYKGAAASFGVARQGGLAGFVEGAGTDTYEQASDPLVWPASEERAPDSLGTFLEQGGARDVFRRFAVVLDASVKMLEIDRSEGLERRILVDR